MQTIDPHSQVESDQAAPELPAYETPTVTTYTDEQLLEALGPAQAASRYTQPT